MLIKDKIDNLIGEVSEETTLDDIKKAGTEMSLQETYSVYRGQLITIQSGFLTRKIDVLDEEIEFHEELVVDVYLFLFKGHHPNKEPTTFCISLGCNLRSVEDAKRLIDMVLNTGEYSYGMIQ
jgi:hypothetical protein